MAAWKQQDMRLDIAIAVTLEVAALRLGRSGTACERDEARAFNHRLWRGVALLAPTAPVSEDRRDLSAAAGRVEAGHLSGNELAALNIAFAGRLAGRAATGGALRRILAEWRECRAHRPDLEFGLWLVRRLESLAAPDLAWAA